MQIDAGDPMYIAGIITQGRGSSSPGESVTLFRVEYRIDDGPGHSVQLPGTFSMTSPKKEHLFASHIYARYVRIFVLAWNSSISMRAALVVNSCSQCLSTKISQQGSTSLTACECPTGANASVDVYNDWAIYLVSGRAQLATMDMCDGRDYAVTAEFDNTAGPPGGNGAVTFDWGLSQYLDGGEHTFNIASNGGLTVIALVSFRV